MDNKDLAGLFLDILQTGDMKIVKATDDKFGPHFVAITVKRHTDQQMFHKTFNLGDDELKFWDVAFSDAIQEMKERLFSEGRISS